MRRIIIASLGLALISGAASAQPISGPYIGAAGGIDFLQNQRLRGFSPSSVTATAPSPAGMDYKMGYAGLANIGWGFGNGFRLEAEGDMITNDRDFETRRGSLTGTKGRETKTGAMGNVLFDMDIGSPYVFPYLGGGFGMQSVTQKLTQTGTGYSESISGSKSAFAYQAMLGASLPIPPVVGLSGTVEYRYLGLAGTRTYSGSLTSGGTTTAFSRKTTDDNNSMLLVGLRYAFNTPTPAAAPVAMAAAAPAPVAAPAPAPARSYLVFFDWDKSALSTRAQQIIAEAASASTRVASTVITVAGHADKSGTPAYNQSLSLARANNVAAELVRLGVAKTAISISAFGDTKPLVPTADGVREPQNRRVEIVLK